MAGSPLSAPTRNCWPIRPPIYAFIICSSWMDPNRALYSSSSRMPFSTMRSFWSPRSQGRPRNSKMPIYSMTGFARVQVRVPVREQDQLSYTLTIKSVNHRFLDVQLRLPPGLDALEMELRRILKEQLVRGHVEVMLSIDRSAAQVAGYN